MRKHLGTITLLLSWAAAQNSAGPSIVQKVAAVREGAEVRIEITLSAAVQPSVETAVNPDRILLDFPNTVCDSARNLSVAANGVRSVRTAQHSRTPLVTRVVLDLDGTHPYKVSAEGNSIILSVGPAEKAKAGSHGAPVAATSGNLIGIFRKKQDKTAPVVDHSLETPFEPTPPPVVAGPAFEPPAEPSTAAAMPPQSPGGPVAQNPPVVTAANNVAAGTPATGSVSIARGEVAKAAEPPVVTEPSSPTAAFSVEAPVAAAPGVEANREIISAPQAGPSEAESTSGPSTSSGETSTLIARSDDPNLRTVFKVKYVAEGVAYLQGGRAQGLAVGMKLLVEDSNLPAKQGDSVNTADPRIVAELEVSGVAETSAVADIHSPKRPVKVGDLAYLSSSDAQALIQQRTMSATRQYPAVISFTESDTPDEEARQEVPRPPLPSVNRARGRIGFDAIETVSHGTSNVTSSDVGMVFRGDITRIGGTYWNLSGYWRGRLTKESVATQQTLQNLINRTYHLNMTYDNPNSTLVAGFGRLYLPWAPSLDTIDGGYFGKRLSQAVTIGLFGGSTPDPSSWDYSPNRVIGGSFVNFQGGEFNGLHYSSTSGAGVSLLNWTVDRPFVFLEDSLSYKRTFAIYESAQLDSPTGNSVTPSPGPGLGRNFLTVRVSPQSRVELDFNYNYFRDIPTFDPNLVGTGLLDKYLFQGFSAGGRVEVWKQIWLSTNIGQSNGSGDAKTSLNQMYGITFGRIPWVNMRADVHYAQFNGSFGSGSYEAFSLSRQLSERLRLEVLMGQQNFASTLTTNTRSRFITGTVETNLGAHYYLQGNYTANRGDLSYDQAMFSIGYRFDTRRKHE